MVWVRRCKHGWALCRVPMAALFPRVLGDGSAHPAQLHASCSQLIQKSTAQGTKVSTVSILSTDSKCCTIRPHCQLTQKSTAQCTEVWWYTTLSSRSASHAA